MIKAKHHWFLYPFFEWYGWRLMKFHFNKIHMIGEMPDRELPILIIANHFSWWDGFFISSLNKRHFNKKYHVMMLEEQLKKHIFFRYTGAFSICHKQKSILKSLRYTVNLLKYPDNLVTFFPQGQFESSYQQPIKFKRGLGWILANLKNEVQLIFVANLIEYFESARPTLYIYFKENSYRDKNFSEIEKDYNDFFNLSYKKNL